MSREINILANQLVSGSGNYYLYQTISTTHKVRNLNYSTECQGHYTIRIWGHDKVAADKIN